MSRSSISSTLREEVGKLTVTGSPPGETVLAIPTPPSISDEGVPLVKLTTAEPATGHTGAEGADHDGRFVVSGG